MSTLEKLSAVLNYHDTQVIVSFDPEDSNKISDLQAALKQLESEDIQENKLRSTVKKGLSIFGKKLQTISDDL